ncbi:hypothetical protein [Pontibacillus salipaludis]|uniref:hypothetical protein n=1 Tax=Pontibacillus salipaludis TaxID=1697394 RepID=UPI0031F18CC7
MNKNQNIILGILIGVMFFIGIFVGNLIFNNGILMVIIGFVFGILTRFIGQSVISKSKT